MTPIRSRLSKNVYMMLSLPVIAICLLALPGLTKGGLVSARHGAVEPAALATVGFCITDDHTHDNLSFTAGGAYTFTRCKDAFTLSGTGTVRTSGSVVILTDQEIRPSDQCSFSDQPKDGQSQRHPGARRNCNWRIAGSCRGCLACRLLCAI